MGKANEFKEMAAQRALADVARQQVEDVEMRWRPVQTRLAKGIVEEGCDPFTRRRAETMASRRLARVEPHYRAGIRSIKAIPAEFGVSRAAIDKHAKKHGWTRDLRPTIQHESDRLVA